MNHEQARLEALLDGIAERAITYDGDIEAVVPVDTLTELVLLGYPLHSLTDDIRSRTSR